jgi:hypothetical protein
MAETRRTIMLQFQIPIICNSTAIIDSSCPQTVFHFLQLLHSNYLCTYDLYVPVRNVFDAGRYITWASGRGLGPGNLKFLGPKWHSPISLMPFHRVQKTLLPGPNPLPLAHVMFLHTHMLAR